MLWFILGIAVGIIAYQYFLEHPDKVKATFSKLWQIIKAPFQKKR